MKNVLLLFLFFCAISAAFTQNTLTLKDGETSPQATIDDIRWLAGHWTGEAFGGPVEEHWAPPSAGSMVGTFKATKDGKVNFYEIETISEVDGTLILRLKHFHSDLKGWEEKDKTVDFPLVKITEDKAYFEGFTIERVSKKAINMYVLLGQKDGKPQEMKFALKKQKL
ncbi:MAG: hypothetical protein KDD99_15955 [Bacteroidetes bacterium]|nr:hypothetical protein [Bacteroidota bacterium]